MQMLNSLLGGCSNSRSDCNALARDGHCHSNPYATLRECPIACAVPCGKCFTIQPFQLQLVLLLRMVLQVGFHCITLESNWKAVKRLLNDSVDYGGSVIEHSLQINSSAVSVTQWYKQLNSCVIEKRHCYTGEISHFIFDRHYTCAPCILIQVIVLMFEFNLFAFSIEPCEDHRWDCSSLIDDCIGNPFSTINDCPKTCGACY